MFGEAYKKWEVMCDGVTTLIQSMGTASKLIRLMILILLGIILWRLWYYIIPSPVVTKGPPRIVEGLHGSHQNDEMEIVVPSQLRLEVFYEALCPDSRDFVVRQLVPAYKNFQNILALSLIPYGKASSTLNADGSKSFRCQHGEKECKANIVHACASKYVKDQEKSLDVISCMIDINYKQLDPVSVGETCVKKFNEDWDLISKCSTGEEGKNILYHMGKITHDLHPEAGFIPTITINDNRENQQLILQNLNKALCKVYNGPNVPDSCKLA